MRSLRDDVGDRKETVVSGIGSNFNPSQHLQRAQLLLQVWDFA